MPFTCRYRSQVCTLSERMPPTEAVRKDWQHWRDSGEAWHLRGWPSLCFFFACTIPTGGASSLRGFRKGGGTQPAAL
jgi:hypothetical protein